MKKSGRVFCDTIALTRGTYGRPANSHEWKPNTRRKASARKPSTELIRAKGPLVVTATLTEEGYRLCPTVESPSQTGMREAAA